MVKIFPTYDKKVNCKKHKLHPLSSSLIKQITCCDCINILIMKTSFDSKRIGNLTFIYLGDPAPGSYYLQGLIYFMYLIS